ncbi:uncharacterized protein DNG_03268 [Cephalotrichum gorgonifer]|uniref:C2H2-type domain-containing protein n=1 Tax=Cephalotrichum gorgonifer TaxID=2041049 RepID=A0AAE8STE6_9PEZI|nr:uncharacterized protein DNG_03268 [Cephalotrichum gorgonifer]
MPSSSLSNRQSHSRTSSQSVLLGPGPLPSNNRVTRRKSMNNGAPNVAAITAAIKDAEDVSSSLPSAGFGRRHTVSKVFAGRGAPTSLLTTKLMADRHAEIPEHAIDDDPADGSPEYAAAEAQQKARIRRASDGQPLTKEGRKSRAELRCEKCGKGYKHSSCLTKHLWEHTPEWSYTSKLLISKHQQVQLLEAASVLVAMNNDPAQDENATAAPPNAAATPPDSARGFPSDVESSSPTASGYSEMNDRQSSADTTPPPHQEVFGHNIPEYISKRYSGGGFSRSYQSTPGSGFAGSAPNVSLARFGHGQQQSRDRQLSSSGMDVSGQDDRELAAAVELLSCSFNSSNGGRGVGVPADAPPVPPLPAQYLDQAASLSSAGFINSFPSRQPESFTRGERNRSVDVRMEDSADSGIEEDDEVHGTRARSDEDDDGVFGRMVL